MMKFVKIIFLIVAHLVFLFVFFIGTTILSSAIFPQYNPTFYESGRIGYPEYGLESHLFLALKIAILLIVAFYTSQCLYFFIKKLFYFKLESEQIKKTAEDVPIKPYKSVKNNLFPQCLPIFITSITALAVGLMLVFFSNLFRGIQNTQDVTANLNACIDQWNNKISELPEKNTEQNIFESYKILDLATSEHLNCLNALFIGKNIFIR